nr:glyoxalase I, glyoxalase/bleomycin resistance protein/dihydroxybiphenyl dioxygenase [Tanacetum cinerariifolium]
MTISIVIDGETISAYTPHVGLSDVVKKSFLDALDELVRDCPPDKLLIIGGDLNGHIGAAADGYAWVHKGFGYGTRNEEGENFIQPLQFDCYYSRINQGEVRAALQKMRRNKSLGPDQIPIEAKSLPRELSWRTLIDKRNLKRYLRDIRDMYDGVETHVRSIVGITEFFILEVGLYQASAISPYLFVLILDELLRGIQENIPWSMVFADDIVLVSESADGLNMRLES